MPIEDINYLHENSVKENIIIFSDSSQRDRNAWKTPSEYSITFDTPFYNVYGLEILDAAIPRTMYVVDTHTNLLCFHFGYSMDVNNPDLTTNSSYAEVYITPQDYSMDELVRELDGVLEPYGINALAKSNPSANMSKIKFESTRYPFILDMTKSTCMEVLGFDLNAEPTETTRYKKAYDKWYPKKATSEDIENALSTAPVPSSYNTFTDFYRSKYKECECENKNPTTNERLYGSINEETDTFVSEIVFPQTEVLAVDSEHLQSTSPIMGTLRLSNMQTVASRFSISSLDIDQYFSLSFMMLAVRKGNSSYDYSNKKLRYEIRTSDNSNSIDDLPTNSAESTAERVLYTGTLELKTRTQMADLLTNTYSKPGYTSYLLNNSDDTDILYAVNYDTSIDVGLQNGNQYDFISLYSNDSTFYWLVVYNDDDESDSGGEDSSLYVYISTSSESISDTSTIPVFVTKTSSFSHGDDELNVEWSIVNNINGTAVSSGTASNTDVNIAPCLILFFKQYMATLEAPGVVSLVAERYVILRNKEIDDHIQMSYGFSSTSPGIALFKLGVIGYSQERFDFSSIKYREFHPIGKLSKLTFRFERLDGSLYDFKGVNHHMLMVVKYLAPRNKSKFEASILNPNYNPNFIDTLRDKRDFDEKQDSDEEQLDPKEIDEQMRVEKQYIAKLALENKSRPSPDSDSSD